ncbi:LacI family DNA-binding transcriptional regulator [Halomonas alkalisoli]|uniref:LacI family DNA-binding transcriptional regulator n=1 Tax=Halomonas alkalisoli TaxID=2907158 RepID=UPI001F453A10|nr:LacI family DNA-binding transcriptional regulator [Halomonas alkalisoli]MCE9682405.1 LacI family DNA-binding transcriptional regulator [Halomonas alkalisoli]
MARDESPSRGHRESGSVTLQDIAAHAGVSRATVSLVLRASPLVAERTRAKVQRSIKSLGYVYNRGAAALRGSRTSTLGVVVYDIANPFFGTMVAGIDAALSRQGYVAFLANSEDSPERQQRFLERMREHRVDALLLCPAEGTSPTLIETLTEWKMPCIQVLRHIGAPPFDYAGTDFRYGVCLAMDHLVGLGHQRIAYLGGHIEHSATQERWQGYRDALERHDLGYQRLLRAKVTRRNGFELIQQLMAESPPPTAVVCHNDLVAFGAMLGLKRMGLVPGRDCAVIGTDDVEEAALSDPALTSVATHPYAIGEEAARLALRRIAHPDGAREQVVLSPQLKIRDSCGASLAASSRLAPTL